MYKNFHFLYTKHEGIYLREKECVRCHAIKNKIKNNAVDKVKKCDITDDK